ncbi:MAG TPA: hypothetical protein VGL19_17575, partial [Polyangiaceae bacterium]
MGRVLNSSKQRLRAFREAGEQPRGAEAKPRLIPLQRAARRSGRLRTLLAGLRPHRASLLLISVLGLSAVAIDMLWPLASRYMVDRVILQPGVP